MGALYDFHCPVCDGKRQEPDIPWMPFERGTPLGCGLSYPYVCKNIYEDIRKGRLGVDAQKALRRMLKPAIYHSADVFVCESCKKWKAADNIKICRLKPGKSDRGSALDRERDAQAGPRLKPLCYLDREIYHVVWENTHTCAHCGGRMHPQPRAENLTCNRCGSPLEISVVGHWD